jgi:hypothetical protein
MGNCPRFRDHASHAATDYFDLIEIDPSSLQLAKVFGRNFPHPEDKQA